MCKMFALRLRELLAPTAHRYREVPVKLKTLQYVYANKFCPEPVGVSMSLVSLLLFLLTGAPAL